MYLAIAFFAGMLIYAIFLYVKRKIRRMLDKKSAEAFELYIKSAQDLNPSECYLYRGDTVVCDHMLVIDREHEILCFVSCSDGEFREKRYPFSSLLSSRVHESDTELSVVATFRDINEPSQIIVLQRSIVGKLDKTDGDFIASRKTAEKINAFFNTIISRNKILANLTE